MRKQFLHPPFIFMILLTQLFLACGQNQENKTPVAPIIVSENDEQFSVDTFSTFPPEIDGCACYFSNNETEFKNNKYIYADDFGSNAFVSINGTITKLELSKSDTLSGNRSVKTFVNDKYEITIDVKQIGQLDETWQKTGTIKIKPKNGKEIIKNIYGECGC